jgi:flagellar basal-body rod protein FlgC
MGAFDAIDIGRTGLGFSRYWMDNISHNLANVNTITGPDEEPFRARFVVARPNTDQIAPTGSGVHVAAVVEAEGDPARVYSPDHPLADDEGYVTQAAVDLAGQLTDMMIANRTYQANARTIQTAREAYETALRLGSRG